MSWHLLDALPKDGTRVLFFIESMQNRGVLIRSG